MMATTHRRTVGGPPANVQNNNRRNSIAKVLGVLQRRSAGVIFRRSHDRTKATEPTSGTVGKYKATSRREGGSDGYRGSVEAETKSPLRSRRRELA